MGVYLHVFFIHFLTNVVDAVLGQATGVNVQLRRQVALRCDGQLFSEGRLYLLSALMALSVGDERQDGLAALTIQVLQPVMIQVPPGEHLLHLVILRYYREFPLGKFMNCILCRHGLGGICILLGVPNEGELAGCCQGI